ncbi:MAG: alpha-L-rhamnosidase C-terminal domain-containing protein [Bryobacteraceae bacterium]
MKYLHVGHLRDALAGTGLVPDIAPEFTVFSGGFRDSPEWGSSIILVPWQHYLFTGDDSLLRNYYSAMTNYFGYLQNQAVNDFLNYPNGLGDWYQIATTPVSLTADAYYCQDAQILGQAAAEIGNANDATRFNLLATNIGTTFNSTYYSNGSYSTGSQTANALPLYLGIVNPTNQAAVLAALIANITANGLTCGEIGHRYLLRTLTDMGRPDVVFSLHSGTNDPGYGYILSQGATALTEAWDANPADSQDHFMLGHITEWFYHDLAGIQYDPALPGFQHVIIKPAFVGGITWVNASFASVRGMIASTWSLTNNSVTLNVTIPVGSTGSIYLPMLGNITTNLLVKESGTTIWQNGAVAGSATGVAFDHVQGTGSQTFQIWTVGSGSYQFVWNVLSTPTGLKASAGNGQVALSWNSMASASGYNVKRSTTSGGGYVTVAGGVSGTNLTDMAVTNNTTYYYVVSAVSDGIESANSSEVNATPQWPQLSGIISNPGFETPSISTYEYNPSGGSWKFTAQSGSTGSGISANGSAFTSGNSSAPQGVQVAFLQGTATISQTVTGLITGAIYQVAFSAAQRNNIYGQQAGQTWQLRLDGTTIGAYAPPESAQSYVDYRATFTASATSSHTIAFVGTNTNGGDNTVFIDNVRLALAPSLSPPHFTCQVAGGQIRLLWPPDHAGWELQMQTNPLNVGLGTNWTEVLGSALTNQFVLPIGLANGSAFFRAAYP